MNFLSESFFPLRKNKKVPGYSAEIKTKAKYADISLIMGNIIAQIAPFCKL